jgi:hypothetical protein
VGSARLESAVLAEAAVTPKRVSTVGLSSGGKRRKAAVGSDHLDEPGETEMDVALHRLETRLAALEALIARSCVECERLTAGR